MSDQYDVIVIGAGSAGENAAGRCAAAGLSVVIVEGELVGGECSYWACMPSKALLRPGEALASARRVPGARETVGERVDVAAALARRDEIVSHFDDKYQVRWVEDAGVTLVRGRARLTGERIVEVAGPGGATTTLTARRAVVVATGSAPVMPPIEGLRDVRAWTSREATTAKEKPGRLLVLGGGVVGVEMAQAWRRLGTEEVTVIEASERLLAHEEAFVGEELAAAFEEEGISVLTGAKMVGVSREGDDGPVHAALEDGQELIGDELLVAVGRRPRTGELGVDSVGLTSGDAIEVDRQLRATGVPGGWLYAIGDANGRAPLTHMGKYQARLAADHIAGRDVTDVADDGAIPRVIFTDPQVGAVGLTQARAEEQGLEVQGVSSSLGDVAAATLHGESTSGTAKIVVDEKRGVLVGATFTGPSAGELVHAATIAVVAAVPLDRLWHAVPSFPTLSEVWLRLLEEYGL